MSEIVHVEAEIIKAGDLVQAQTAAEVDMQIATAKKYPRVLSRVRDKVMELATIDQETAEKCWYALPRGGKVIEGPSVRLAEIVVASYGNLRAASRIAAIDEKHVTCQAVCIDLENNVAVQTEVKRRITDKYGNRYNDDMIVTTSNAASSIALRNAVFKTVPMVLFKSILDKVKKVGMGDERTFAENRKAVLTRLIKMGATSKQIAELTGKRAETDLTMEDVQILKGLIVAIEEGTTTIEEAFKPERKAAETGKIDMASIKAGDPATHQGHDDKTPMKPAETPKAEEKKPPAREPGEEESEAEPAESEEYAAELATAKDDLQGILAGINPGVSDAVLTANGINNLESCTDLARIRRAIEAAKWAVEKPAPSGKGKRK